MWHNTTGICSRLSTGILSCGMCGLYSCISVFILCVVQRCSMCGCFVSTITVFNTSFLVMKLNHKAIGELGMLSKAVMPHCNINHRAVSIIWRLRSVHIPMQLIEGLCYRKHCEKWRICNCQPKTVQFELKTTKCIGNSSLRKSTD